MAELIYHVVQHDGGWAYRVDGTFSETFPNHDAAHRAADRAAREQRLAGETVGIVYEDAGGRWRQEIADGGDRPATRVDD
jgi:predicted secreted protein